MELSHATHLNYRISSRESETADIRRLIPVFRNIPSTCKQKMTLSLLPTSPSSQRLPGLHRSKGSAQDHGLERSPLCITVIENKGGRNITLLK